MQVNEKDVIILNKRGYNTLVKSYEEKGREKARREYVRRLSKSKPIKTLQKLKTKLNQKGVRFKKRRIDYSKVITSKPRFYKAKL